MKVGDLVQYIGEDADQPPLLGLGIVMGFDHDEDPIVLFQGDDYIPTLESGDTPGSPFYDYDIEVISETR